MVYTRLRFVFELINGFDISICLHALAKIGETKYTNVTKNKHFFFHELIQSKVINRYLDFFKNYMLRWRLCFIKITIYVYVKDRVY